MIQTFLSWISVCGADNFFHHQFYSYSHLKKIKILYSERIFPMYRYCFHLSTWVKQHWGRWESSSAVFLTFSSHISSYQHSFEWSALIPTIMAVRCCRTPPSWYSSPQFKGYIFIRVKASLTLQTWRNWRTAVSLWYTTEVAPHGMSRSRRLLHTREKTREALQGRHLRTSF